MISKQEIQNTALMRFGDISTLSSTQTYIESLYSLGIQYLMSLDYWNFAQKITSLGLISSNNDIPNYKYTYVLPSDLASIFSVYNKTFIDRNYKIVANNLYSNTTPLSCQYSSSDEQTSYPAHFANALSLWLAKELCVVLGSSQLQPNLAMLFNEAMLEARGVNGRDRPSLVYFNDYYSSSRLTGGYGNYGDII